MHEFVGVTFLSPHFFFSWSAQGSYANLDGGNVMWAMRVLTGDPVHKYIHDKVGEKCGSRCGREWTGQGSGRGSTRTRVHTLILSLICPMSSYASFAHMHLLPYAGLWSVEAVGAGKGGRPPQPPEHQHSDEHH